MRLHKSLKIWSLYADLEESFGTFKSTKAVYDRILDLKIATPQIIINYGLFLKENNYFEEAFKAYEKGISLFKWPNVYDIWNTYLSEFLARYGGSKLERTRDLFEQCLDEVTKNVLKKLNNKSSKYCFSAPSSLQRTFSCCMLSWRRSTGWQGMPWQSTIELSKRFLSFECELLGSIWSCLSSRWMRRSRQRCTTSTYARLLRFTG